MTHLAEENRKLKNFIKFVMPFVDTNAMMNGSAGVGTISTGVRFYPIPSRLTPAERRLYDDLVQNRVYKYNKRVASTLLKKLRGEVKSSIRYKMQVVDSTNDLYKRFERKTKRLQQLKRQKDKIENYLRLKPYFASDKSGVAARIKDAARRKRLAKKYNKIKQEIKETTKETTDLRKYLSLKYSEIRKNIKRTSSQPRPTSSLMNQPRYSPSRLNISSNLSDFNRMHLDYIVYTLKDGVSKEERYNHLLKGYGREKVRKYYHAHHPDEDRF
jgi:hypothetical protein